MRMFEKQGIPVLGKILEPQEICPGYSALRCMGSLGKWRPWKGRIPGARPQLKVGSYFPWVNCQDEKFSVSLEFLEKMEHAFHS